MSLLVWSYGVPAPKCERCGGEVQKLITRFYALKSEESRLEDMADLSQFADVDEKDPRSMARFMRRMASQVGEDLGDDFKEMVERMEAGEMPEEMGPGGPGEGEEETSADEL